MTRIETSNRRAPVNLLLIAAGLLLPACATAGVVSFHGRVVMEDGSAPGRLVGIQRVCDGAGAPVREANASPKTGEYFVRLYVDPFGAGFGGGWRALEMLTCYLEAVAPGFSSTRLNLNDRRTTSSPQLPDIVLSRQTGAPVVDLSRAPDVPRPAARPWSQALKRITAEDWAGAERSLRDTVAAAPNFGPAWAALGAACRNQGKPPCAREALGRAIQLDPKRLSLRMDLAGVQAELKEWAAAAATADALIAADSSRTYLEAYLVSAVARYEQRDYDSALARINELIRLDSKQQAPRAGYIRGVILEARGELDAAAAEMRRYLDQHPRSADAAAVKHRLDNLGKQPATDLAAEASTANLRVLGAGEAPVPGGIKAFSAIARIPGTPGYGGFFLEYCRAIVGQVSTEGAKATPTREASDAIRAFISTIPELERLGERTGDRVVIRISLESPEVRQKAERVLELLGWRLRQAGAAYRLDAGDQLIDGLRQRIPGAFGVDELELRDAIEAGRPFRFEIPLESARLVGGAAWGAALKDAPAAALGAADVFIRDMRFARAYAGLASMEPDTAAAVVAGVGLVALIGTYSEALAAYGDALSVSGGRVAIPGGIGAEAAWSKLAGVSPESPAAFFRALFERDSGMLLPFFFDLSRADAAHQRFFTATPVRAEAAYQWYRASFGLVPPAPAKGRWQAEILQALALSPDGSVQFPGGRRTWSTAAGTDDEVLFHLASLGPLAAVTRLERKRGRTLDAESVALLAQHYPEWRALFPYFERLPGLGTAEFESLARFSQKAERTPPAQQGFLIGQWHSLAAILILASDAGGLDAGQAARGFGRVCDALGGANFSAGAVQALREIAGGGTDPDEALAAGLLRLRDREREAFDRAREMQRAPSIASLGGAPDPAKTLAALSGAVYAAVLGPDRLLVAEDAGLLYRHDFLRGPDGLQRLFADSGIVISNAPPGSRFVGGFAAFRDLAASLEGVTPELAESTEAELTAAGSADAPANRTNGPSAPPPSGLVFRASGRIVEVYATVTDTRGRYIDDLNGGDFAVQVEGRPTSLFAFENRTANVSVALLLDTTGSMNATLPSLKNAAMRLTDELRPGDSVAVYGFNDRLTELQPFTTDKTAVKRGILRAHAAGTTALYDALVRVNRDLAQRRGKKVIIVFTDGDDNASALTADAAIRRARSGGIPVYAIAQGEALLHKRLVDQLTNISQTTGGAPFLISRPEDIGEAFQKMSEDLMHGYLLAFQPPPASGGAWRRIAVAVGRRKGLVVRAREGYYAE